MRKVSASLLGLVVAGVAFAQAGGVRFDLSASSESITLDQTIEVTVSLHRDGSQPFEAYRAPSWPDFDVLHTATNEQMQFATVNGRQSVLMIEQHVYVLKPRKKGALAIAPASVRIGGNELKTRALTIHVGAPLKNAYSSKAPEPQLPTSAPENMRGDEDLFVDGAVDKPKVYVGQQLTASWTLYTQTEILKYRPLAEPKYEDFWSEDLFLPTTHLPQDRVLVKGRDYVAALLLKKALFPLRAGKLTITPFEAEVTTLQSAFSPGASAVRKSRALTVDVMALPVEGRPSGFEAANVGRFELSSSVDRTAVKAGEAVTWKVTVRGVGNIRNVRLPKLERLDGFRVYEPTSKETIEPGDEIHGQKVYTYLLLPQKGGALTLPAVELAYFDPAAAKYAVAKSQPIALTVSGDPTQVEASAAAASPTENVLAQQIRPIRNRAAVRSGIGDRLFRGKLAAVMLAAPPGAWLLVLVGDALRRRLGRETAGSKRRRARRSARRRMRVAEYHIRAQRPSAFFGECARILYEHLEYRLGNKVEAFTLGELREHLIARAFEREVVEATVKELENCDFSRFAPSASGPGEMRAALRRVRALLPLIEKQKPIELEPTMKSDRSGFSRPIVIGGVVLALFGAGSNNGARAADTEIAASKDATFRRGNEAYFHGRYQEAVDAYEQVAALGVSSVDLFYNLGNAYLKAGRLGPAIYNYERAVDLDPQSDDVRFNLGVAREAARKKGEDRLAGAEAQPFWMRWAGQVTVNWASWLFASLWLSLFGLLIALHFVQPGFLRVGMWAGFAFLSLATGIAGALLGARLYLADRVEQAIVLPDVVQVKEGPDPNYQSVFGVHAGLRVRITEKEQDWVRVRLANGLEGWVRERDLGRL